MMGMFLNVKAGLVVKNNGSMNNFWKITAAIAILVIGIIIGRAFWGCGETPDISRIKKESEQKIKKYQDSIDLFSHKLADLQIRNFHLSDSLGVLNQDYAKLRNKALTQKGADSLTSELNRKGRAEFGNDGNNNRTTSALLYGNQFADNNGILKKQIENQKAQIVNCQGIIVYKDTIIQVQKITIQDISKTTKREKRKAFLKGGLIVGGVVAIIFLAL